MVSSSSCIAGLVFAKSSFGGGSSPVMKITQKNSNRCRITEAIKAHAACRRTGTSFKSGRSDKIGLVIRWIKFQGNGRMTAPSIWPMML